MNNPAPAAQNQSPVAAIKKNATVAVKPVVTGMNRTWHFMDGTIRGALDYCANYGRKGFWAGLIAGAAAMLIPGGMLGFSFLMLPIAGAVAVGGAGAALGIVRGTLTGGAERLALEDRKAKYADELEDRRSARAVRTGRGISNREYEERLDYIDRINQDRLDQYNDNQSVRQPAESTSYQAPEQNWTDRVDASRSNYNDLER